MKRIICITLALWGVILLSGGPALAESQAGHDQGVGIMEEEHIALDGEESTKDAVEVGNKICPVSGEAVGSMGPGARVEYKGKVYNLCCAMCKDEFLTKADKYAGIAEQEVRVSRQK